MSFCKSIRQERESTAKALNRHKFTGVCEEPMVGPPIAMWRQTCGVEYCGYAFSRETCVRQMIKNGCLLSGNGEASAHREKMEFARDNLTATETETTRRWHAIYVRPSHETQVAKRFIAREIESYLPKYRVERRWKNRCVAKLDLPLFPGYIFARISKNERVRVLDVPSVIFLVGTAGRPTPLPDNEIDSLRAGLTTRNAQPHPFLKEGERARIQRGALGGMEGVVIRLKNSVRVVINLDLIMRSVAVEVDSDDLEPIPK